MYTSFVYHILKKAIVTLGSKLAAGLKRESSSGSDEALAEKAKLKRWSSQEELSTHLTRNVSSEQGKREKKRRSKAASFKSK